MSSPIPPPAPREPSPQLSPLDWIVALTAISWVVMQWWWASPISYQLGQHIPLLDRDEQKFVHLSFGFILAALALVKGGASGLRGPLAVLLPLAAVALFASPCLYLLIQSDALAGRAGKPVGADIVFGVAGIFALLFFTSVTLSRGLMIFSALAIGYLLWGDIAALPESLRWKGASVEKTVSHLWLYTEGVFGISIGVATQFIFLFVLFGEIMQRMGFGKFITKLSVLLLSGQKAGSAKAAILSSTAIGSISGSSTANVVTTGNFTIPLMREDGMSPEEAGAVEVAASSNGQLMPPIMGAAAFLIAEYTSTPYNDLVFYALLPASCAFFGLLCLVHLRACAIEGLAPLEPGLAGTSLRARLLDWHRHKRLWRFCARAAAIIVAVGLIYYFRQRMSASVFFALAAFGLIGLYVYWAYREARSGPDAGQAEAIKGAQSVDEIWRAGAHFSLPIAVLLWLLIVEGLSPQLSVWWSALAALLMLITRPALRQWFARGDFIACIEYYRSAKALSAATELCVTTAKRMLPITLATACAGIIVGAITLSGLQQILGDIVLNTAGDSLVLLLILLALASLLLGLGLPTTPNYILISSLFATVLFSATEQFGVPVSLVAVHLFILYFGVLADDTPPVGLCAYAASAISGGDPIRTGIRAFVLDSRTAILPFAFIFNPDLLLIDLGFFEGLMVAAVALAAMYLFSAVLQSWLIVRNSFVESALLLAASLVLLCPQWLHMQLFPVWHSQPLATLFEPKAQSGGATIRIEVIDAETGDAKILSFEAEAGQDWIGQLRAGTGLALDQTGVVNEVDLFSPADDLEIVPDSKIAKVELKNESSHSPRWLWLIGVVLAAVVAGVQLRRRKRLLAAAPPPDKSSV